MNIPEFIDKYSHHKPIWFGTENSKNKKLIVTVSGKNDRFGSQYCAQMSGFALARYHNCIYRFSEFFGDKDSKIASEFCGLKSDDDDDITRTPEIQYYRHCDKTQNKDVNLYFNENVRQELRTLYYRTWKPETVKCDVAIHIRRGDVGCIDNRGRLNKDGTPYRHWEQRYNCNDYYKKCIEYIRKDINNQSLKFVIFSQGKDSDFDDLVDENVSLFLNNDWRIAFHSMVEAKILVGSISEFSWTAAILSKGIIYRNEKMFRSPLNDWRKLIF